MELGFGRIRDIWDAWYAGRDTLTPGRDPGETLEHYIVRECVPVLFDGYSFSKNIEVGWNPEDCWDENCECDCHE